MASLSCSIDPHLYRSLLYPSEAEEPINFMIVYYCFSKMIWRVHNAICDCLKAVETHEQII